MNMEQAYNDQMKVMREMVEELKKLNESVAQIGVIVGFDKLKEMLDELGDVVNGNQLASELEDDEDEDGFCTNSDCDCHLNFDEEDDGEETPYTLGELAIYAEEDARNTANSDQLPYTLYGTTYYSYNASKDIGNLLLSINVEKGAVAALLKDPISGKIVRRGVARCHPNDVFLESVGVAIALRRLFDLEVPQWLIQEEV